MTDFSLLEIVQDSATIIIPILLILLSLIVLYYVLIIRAIRQMLLHRVPGVLLTFSFISLVPFPLTVVMGIMILIIWHYHKKDLQAGSS